jgi:hypothetical protein
VVVPAVTPVTIPVDEPMAAMDGLLLPHVPPVPAVRVIVPPPTHTSVGPEIGGVVMTVAIIMDWQPEAVTEYVKGAVPTETPCTVPVPPEPEVTVAVPVAPLVHVPGLGKPDSVVVPDEHTMGVPEREGTG